MRVCATHPDVEATGHCGRCGDFICSTCTHHNPVEGTFLCVKCDGRLGDSTATPVVWYIQIVYCTLIALLFLLLTFSTFVELFSPTLEADNFGVALTIGIVFLVIFVSFAVAPFLPRRPWAWIYHLCLIALSMANPAFIPLAIPLLIFWLRDNTRGYFGQS